MNGNGSQYRFNNFVRQHSENVETVFVVVSLSFLFFIQHIKLLFRNKWTFTFSINFWFCLFSFISKISLFYFSTKKKKQWKTLPEDTIRSKNNSDWSDYKGTANSINGKQEYCRQSFQKAALNKKKSCFSIMRRVEILC